MHAARGCTVTFAVTYGVELAYGVDATMCTMSDAAHSPAVFWVHTADAHTVVFCMPTVEVLNISVEVALQTGDMQRVQVVGNYSGGSAMLTDSMGRAMNVVGFDLSGADAWVFPPSLPFAG